MTLLGNFVEMSGQEEQDPFKWNKRSGRSMRGQNQRLHQEGMGSRTASHAVHTPPIRPLFSLFSCPYKISQQSHKSAPTGILPILIVKNHYRSVEGVDNLQQPIMIFKNRYRQCHPERSEG